MKQPKERHGLRRSVSPYPSVAGRHVVPDRLLRKAEQDIISLNRMLFPIDGPLDPLQFRVVNPVLDKNETDFIRDVIPMHPLPVGDSVSPALADSSVGHSKEHRTSSFSSGPASPSDSGGRSTTSPNAAASGTSRHALFDFTDPVAIRTPARHVRSSIPVYRPLKVLHLIRPSTKLPTCPINPQPDSSSKTNLDIFVHEHGSPSPAAFPKPHVRFSTPPDDGRSPVGPDAPVNANLADGQHSLTQFRRKIRGVEAHVVWYLSQGMKSLLQPTDSIDCAPGDLFVHRSAEDGATKIWVRSLGENWDIIRPGGSHPVMPLYRLRILATGEPRWITRKTETTYRGREKRQPNVL